jgi:hypothetical protein
MFYPGSRIWIPKFVIPDPGGKKSTGSRILLNIKRGIKNKTNFFFLLLVVSGTNFNGKKK